MLAYFCRTTWRHHRLSSAASRRLASFTRTHKHHQKGSERSLCKRRTVTSTLSSNQDTALVWPSNDINSLASKWWAEVYRNPYVDYKCTTTWNTLCQQTTHWQLVLLSKLHLVNIAFQSNLTLQQSQTCRQRLWSNTVTIRGKFKYEGCTFQENKCSGWTVWLGTGLKEIKKATDISAAQSSSTWALG